MSAEPLTREEVREWSTDALREHTAGVSWSVLDRMIATVQAAEADRGRALDDLRAARLSKAKSAKRAERLRAFVEHMHSWDHHEECNYSDDHPEDCDCFRKGVDAALAADDAARGDQ